MVYPPFNELPSEVRGCMDWSAFLDSDCHGWFYDKVENLGMGGSVEHACTLVPASFAEAAQTAWPSLVEILTESEFSDFHDTRHAAHEPETIVDRQAVEDLLALIQLEEKKLTQAPSNAELARRSKMLDPNDPTPGVRINRKKRWMDRKSLHDITLDTSLEAKGLHLRRAT